MSRDAKRVTVYLFGGLGNQLFQYFAGLATAEAIGAKLYLKPYGQTSAVGREGEVGIAALMTEGVRVSASTPPWFQEKLLRRFINLFDRVIFRRFLLRCGFFFSDTPDLYSLKYHPAHHIRLIGYFQDNKFLKYLEYRNKKASLRLVSPSPWFANLEAEARKIKPILIHIRRGDYLMHADTIGVLDFSYFKNALNLIPRNKNSQYWILSDSVDAAKNFVAFAELPETKTRIIQAPWDSPDAESMLLLTYGSALVISNSTFSWWGAYLNKSADFIVTPKKWFKALEDPAIHTLEKCIPCESVWKD